MKNCDVLIIGGGPAGAIAGANLAQKGFSVEIIEKLDFPRFVIGESLLPLCNKILAKNNLLTLIEKQNYMVKNGAIFQRKNSNTGCVEEVIFNFKYHLDEPFNSSFQVKRESFDDVLLKGAVSFGARVSHGVEVMAYDQANNQITTKNREGKEEKYQAKFVLDTSGYGRVLPHLLDLDSPSELKVRNAIFTRIKQDIRPKGELAGFITIFIHDENQAWIWVIPFSDGTTSVGIVCDDAYFKKHKMNDEEFFDHVMTSNSQAKERFQKAQKLQSVQRIEAYSSKVKQMHGKGYALAGNATEFLDPIFSSGVTLALKSGDLVAELIAKELNSKKVDWQEEYEDEIMRGMNVFRAFVNAWYDGKLHQIFFSKNQKASYAREISMVLSGYVWNRKNIFVEQTEEKIDLLVKLINNHESKENHT